MSTTRRDPRRTLPPLVPGQRVDLPTFHERSEAMPPGTRAELIGGVVRMPSPVFDDHAEADHAVTFWLVSYKRATPGLRSGSNASTILGPDAEVQPDSQLRLPAEAGGRARVDGGYITGPPELVVEVSGSSRPYDLGKKKDAYERAGVPEYVVVGLDPPAVRWFVLRGGTYADLPPAPTA
ncbi:Uma2 family endonuclease [Tautonia plasticadhaerens]|uniref:Putative restriction endonuclease domain-containing protein n=1 Tax=Tautonia plasticadhaerens TaxID=2527974 RepID=A0A518HBV7_9BACT|nr:Uma2 family endonuclease [Tautonia plasticadhaerens]QDV38353.1 hypothetical protein ElP_63050 [Tautonia plasticadhaerens]